MKKVTSIAIIAILIIAIWFGFNFFKENKTDNKVNIEMIENFIDENYETSDDYKVTYKDFKIIIKEENLKDDSIRTIISEVPYSIKWEEVILDKENTEIFYICREWRWQQTPWKELCK